MAQPFATVHIDVEMGPVLQFALAVIAACEDVVDRYPEEDTREVRARLDALCEVLSDEVRLPKEAS